VLNRRRHLYSVGQPSRWALAHISTISISVLVAQIRKSVRKKHILPAYKLRYQPFFTTPSMAPDQATPAPKDIYVSGQSLNVGRLHVHVLNCTRLIQLSAHDTSVYCTVSIGNCSCAFSWFSLNHFVLVLFAFVLSRLVFFSTMPKDWMERTSLK